MANEDASGNAPWPMGGDAPWLGDDCTLDEIHITIEQFEDEARYEADGTVVIDSLRIRHRCPDGSPCSEATKFYAAHQEAVDG